MNEWVFADVHGNLRGLRQIFSRAPLVNGDKIVSLGDLCDRGPSTYGCIEFLLRMRDKYEMVFVRGNHDDYFNTFMETSMHPVKWKSGGVKTAASYLRAAGFDEAFQVSSGGGYLCKLTSGDIPESHRDFFRRQVYYYVDDNNNLFVHGGFNRHYEFKNQHPDVLMWDRDMWLSAMSYDAMEGDSCYTFKCKTKFNHIYIGHTSLTNWREYQDVATELLHVRRRVPITTPKTISNITNLDTGSGNEKGRLTMLNINSKEIFQSDFVKELYPNLQ